MRSNGIGVRAPTPSELLSAVADKSQVLAEVTGGCHLPGLPPLLGSYFAPASSKKSGHSVCPRCLIVSAIGPDSSFTQLAASNTPLAESEYHSRSGSLLVACSTNTFKFCASLGGLALLLLRQRLEELLHLLR